MQVEVKIPHDLLITTRDLINDHTLELFNRVPVDQNPVLVVTKIFQEVVYAQEFDEKKASLDPARIKDLHNIYHKPDGTFRISRIEGTPAQQIYQNAIREQVDQAIVDAVKIHEKAKLVAQRYIQPAPLPQNLDLRERMERAQVGGLLQNGSRLSSGFFSGSCNKSSYPW